jgi:hypothetical protein
MGPQGALFAAKSGEGYHTDSFLSFGSCVLASII